MSNSQYGTYDSEAYPVNKLNENITVINRNENFTVKSLVTGSNAIRLCLLGFLSLLLFQYYPTVSMTKSVNKSTSDMKVAELNQKYYQVVSIYNKDYPQPEDDKIEDFYPFLQSENTFLMEPYRENHVLLVTTRLGSSCEGYWALNRASLNDSFKSPDNVIAEGKFSTTKKEFVVVPNTSPGKYYLTLHDSCSKQSSEVVVWVKYIRRELSTLTDNDREEFLDAYYTLWEVNTKEGKAKFGDRYKSLYYLSMLHHDAANNERCDEFHTGKGFLINHVGISLYLEQSLQLVNPRVCLHYMEYTKYFLTEGFEYHKKHSLDGGNWTELMTSKWFGSNDPETGEILDGRWAAAKIPRMDETFFEEHEIDPHQSFFPHNSRYVAHASGNPYGLLRSAWNFSPHQGILRFNNVDRIGNEFDAFQDASDFLIRSFRGNNCSDFTAFTHYVAMGGVIEDIMENMEGGVHGPAHFTIAGAGGNPQAANDAVWREKFGLSDQELMDITSLTQVYPHAQLQMLDSTAPGRTMLCYDYPFQDGKLISDGDPGQPGGPWCTAKSSVLESDSAMDEFISNYFLPFMTLPEKLKALPTDLKREAIQLLHQRYQYDGDLATSTGSVDPVFWMIHGSVERLFQRILLADMVTDKSYTTTMECTGHSADGKKQWLNGFFFQDETVSASNLMNSEILAILDPTSDQYPNMIPYVYSSMTWKWCDGLDEKFVGRIKK